MTTVREWPEDLAEVRLVEHDQEENAPPPRSVSLAEMLADPFCLEPPPTVGLPGVALGRVTLLVAREKTGKSTVAAWVAARVTRGEGTSDGEPGNVLIVRLEGHPDEWVQALVRFGADINRTFLLHGLDHLSELADEIQARQPSLVIIDTLPALATTLQAINDAQGDSHGWTALINGLAAMIQQPPAPALVLVHHANKGTGEYRDSSAIGASVDMILTMTVGKADPTERVFAPLGRWSIDPYRLRLYGDRFAFLDNTDPTTHSDPKSAILAYIRQHPRATSNAIKRGVGKNASAVLSAIKALEAEGLIYNSGSPRTHAWSVTQAVPATVPEATPGITSEPSPEPVAPLEVSSPENGSGTIQEPLRNHLGTGSTNPGFPGVGSPYKGTHPEPVRGTAVPDEDNYEREERRSIQAEAET